MIELFNRVIKISIEDIKIEKLRMTFNITKTMSNELENANITIYNLSNNTRNKIRRTTYLDERVQGSPVIVEAGYSDLVQQVFSGEVTFISHEKKMANIITSLDASNQYLTCSTANVEKSFSKGVTAKELVEYLISQLGLDPQIETVKEILNNKRFDRNYILSGQIRSNLNQITKLLDLSWTIQDKKLIILKQGQPLSMQAIEVSSNNGLISVKRTNEGYDFFSLLNPQIKPGHLVYLKSKLNKNIPLLVKKINLNCDNFQGSFSMMVNTREVAEEKTAMMSGGFS